MYNQNYKGKCQAKVGWVCMKVLPIYNKWDKMKYD